MKKIVLTGGGTGGHVTPHIALFRYLKNYEIHYIGTDGIEKEIMSKYPFVTFHTIQAHKLERKLTIKNLLLPYYLCRSRRQAMKHLKIIRPDIVFSKGGFVSVPVTLAAHRLHIPIISHESDLSMGLANKVIYRVCDKMCTSFEKTASNLSKATYTGSPIREQLFKGSKSKGQELTRLGRIAPTIMFVGGSTGAMAINSIIYDNIDKLTSKYNIIHITGRGKGNNIRHKHYYQIEFTDQIEHLLAITDVVVGRAGSNVINELLALHKPMILIPLPRGRSRGDQVDNALEFNKCGYADVLMQKDLTYDSLTSHIDNVIANKQKYISNMSKKAQKDGGYEIYKIIDTYTK